MPSYQQLREVRFKSYTTALRDSTWPDPPNDLVIFNTTTQRLEIYLEETWQAFVEDPDAGDITYTPAVLTDWDSDTDPGDLDDALDQLAERVDDMELLYVSHPATFIPDAENLAADTLNPRAFCVGESGEHGTLTAIRAKAVAGTAGLGTNTILVEADDNPAFSSATTLFTLALDTSTEVDDTGLDNTWAAGDIWVRARCTALGGTAPKNVVVQFFYKEQAQNF